jgi:acetyltransferase-like isoleucine patch superfamily enzyme
VQHLPEGASEVRYAGVTIKDDAYIGANCIIMPGVTIGEGALIGAGSFVNKDVEPWSIYVGTPAKKVRDREKPTPERRAIVEAMDWSNHL